LPASSNYNEFEILHRVAAGDEEAFRDLFYKHKDKLYSFVFDLSRSGQQAEDIVQDVFLKIWIAREKLTGVEYFSAYLFRVARNHAIDQLRKLERESTFLSALARIESPEDSPEDSLALKEIKAAFQKALDKLPPQQRRIYQMHKEEGLKHNEIAEALGLSVSTVQNHLYRAIENIRSHLLSTYPYAGLFILIVISVIWIAKKNLPVAG
jgi:RNA polymerase sigma-70 factor (family 1)